MQDGPRQIGAPVLFQLGVTPGNADEFELWRWSVSPMFRMDAIDPLDRSAFTLNASSYHFADMAVATTRSSGTRFERNRSVIARHGIDSIIIQCYRSGGYELTINGKGVAVKAGDVVLLDMTRECLIEGIDFTQSSMVLPRALLVDMLPNVEQIHGTVLPVGSAMNILLRNHMATAHTIAPSLTALDARAVAQSSAALVAAAFRASAKIRNAVPASLAVATMQTLRQYIDGQLDDLRLGPEHLIDRFGVSRATLYRMFEPLGGVRNYIHQRRLTRAYQTLSDPSISSARIGRVAQEFGFTSDAVFSRSFRKAYGFSPRDVRDIAKTGATLDKDINDDGNSFWSMNRWLLGLDPQGR